MSFGEWLFLLWFFIVYFSYLYFHDGMKIFVLNVILVFSFYIFYKFIYKKIGLKIHWEIRLPLWGVIISLFIITYFIACFLNSIYLYNNGSDIQFLQLLLHWFSIFGVMFSRAVFLLALFVLCASLGRKILRIWNFLFDNVYIEYLFSFGMGMMIMLLVSFSMGALGILYFWYIVLALIAIGLLCIGEIRSTFVNFFSQKVSLCLTDNFSDKKNIIAWGFVFLFLFLLITFIQTFYLIPTESDDMAAYYSVPLLFAHYHGMVPFYNSISAMAGGIVMPLYALVNVLLSPDYNFSISWMFLWFSMISLYFFTQKFFSQKIALITLFLATFVPLNVSFINTQKIDFVLVFFSIMSVHCIFQWIGIRESKWLYLSAVFLGLTINIKMNGFFLALSVFIFLSIFLAFRKIPPKQYIAYFLFAFIILIPMFSYNQYYYSNPIAPFRFRIFAKNTENIFKSQEHVTLYDIYSKPDSIFRKPDDITSLTRQNNVSNSRIINFFWLLWNVTVNQRGFNYVYSEISPFLLIFFPFFLLHFFIKKYYKDKNLALLLAFSVLYFVVWYIRGYERAWYALPILYLLFIFCAQYLEKLEKSKIIAMLYVLIMVFSLRSLFFSFSSMESQPHIVDTSNYSKQNPTKFFQNQLFPTLYEHINKNIIDKNKNSLILMMPESRVGTIQQWDKNVIADPSGLYWSFLLEKNYSLGEIKDIFIKQGITHIFFSNSSYFWIKSFAEKDNKKYTILKNLEMFDSFKDTYLMKNYCVGEYDCIYEIKK